VPQPRLALKLAHACRDLSNLLADIRDPYRPELHYMRGPGPKWHEKHRPGAATAEHDRRLPALAKARA